MAFSPQNSIIIRYLQAAEFDVRRAFALNYIRALFPALGSSTGQTIWKTYRNIVRATLWGHEHFRNNVRLFVVLEALGLGPDYYFVQRSNSRAFADRLFLLTRFLPAQKICFDTTIGLPLGGPFERSERTRQIGVEIAARRIPLVDMPSFCPACHSQFCDHAMEG